MSLADALEEAASALSADADAIRPANGDPRRRLERLVSDEAGGVDAAARVFRWLLEHRPEEGAELGSSWAEEADGAAAVLAVGEAGLPKAGRKALRRIRHRLHSRGVEVPEAAPAPTVATLPKVEEEIDEAVLSPPDPRGHRAAFLVTSHPSGGTRVFELVLDEAQGILDCRVYSAGRRKVRQFLKEFEGQGSAVSVPGDSARAWIARVAQSQPASRPAAMPAVESSMTRQRSGGTPSVSRIRM